MKIGFYEIFFLISLLLITLQALGFINIPWIIIFLPIIFMTVVAILGIFAYLYMQNKFIKTIKDIEEDKDDCRQDK